MANGGLVTFASSCTINFATPISVDNEVVINALDGTNTLSGNNVSRLFTVEPGGSLTLVGLRIINGRSQNAGAIYVKAGGTLVIEDCTFRGNRAVGPAGLAAPDGEDGVGDGSNGGIGGTGQPAHGGAIYNAGATEIYSSQFVTNSATGGNGGDGGDGGDGPFRAGDGGDAGAGGLARGGAIYNSGELAVERCSFTGNTVSGGNGGQGGTAGSGTFPGRDGHGGAGADAYGASLYSLQTVAINQSSFIEGLARGGASGAAGTDDDGNGADGNAGGHTAGGAICLAGYAGVTNSTLFGNRLLGGAGGNGGDGEFTGGNGGNGGHSSGGAVYSLGTTHIVNCTIVRNAATGGTNGVAGSGVFERADDGTPGIAVGGGIVAGTGTIQLRNSILANNFLGGDAAGYVVDRGYNLSSDSTLTVITSGSRANINPLLGPLEDNGGETLTLAPLEGSPAIDRIPPEDAPALDQTGLDRPVGEFSDIGAVESSLGVDVPFELVAVPSRGSPTGGVSNLQLSFQSLPGVVYLTQYKNSLPGTNWSPLVTNVGSGSWITNTISVTNPPARFFRVVR